MKKQIHDTNFLVAMLCVATLLGFAAQANAQMVMEWQSPENVTPATLGFNPPTGTSAGDFRLDFDGDGVKDIPVIQITAEDDWETPIAVISGKEPSTTWQFPFTGVNFVKGQAKLIGFFDVDKSNGNEKEVIIANRVQGAREAAVVINQSGVVKQFGDQYVLLGIADYDNDNDLEMLHGVDTSARVLELWGKGN